MAYGPFTHICAMWLNVQFHGLNHPDLSFFHASDIFTFVVVGGRLDQCSINRRCHDTIAFGH